jgi:hypothetical protein
MLLNKANIDQIVTRRTQDIASPVLGGDIRIQEITRAEWNQVYADADIGDNKVHLARLNAGFFARMVIDPTTGTPMYTADEVMAFPERNALWAEIARIKQAGLDLSETGEDFLPAPSSD